MDLNWHPLVWQELEAADAKLRAACKVHLLKLQERQFGSIWVEKVTEAIWELKVTWNKQEFRFLFFYGASGANFVNFFQKKSRKTPPNELTLATTRMKELQLDEAVGSHGIPH